MLSNDEKNALVSEYGQTEMTALPDGTTIITDKPTIMDLPKGTVLRPLQPGDPTYYMMQKFNPYFESIYNNLEKLIPPNLPEKIIHMSIFAVKSRV